MTERSLRIASVVLGLVGAAVTGYLLWVRQAGTALICASGGCETVRSSPYAEVLGVPVALIGLLGFVTLVATALKRDEGALLVHTALALTAAVFSSYLLYVQIAVIGDTCDWCLVSDGIVSGLAVLALLRMKIAQAAPA